MPITLKKPTGGKLVKGRDHKLRCTLVWDDGEHPNLHTDVAAFYLTVKASDALDDEDAVIVLNSLDNADQFILNDEATPLEGKMVIWIKRTDQDNIIADIVKYAIDLVVVLTDGTEWPFILDYNLIFAQPVTQVTGYVS
jgi:hypothetical protein